MAYKFHSRRANKKRRFLILAAVLAAGALTFWLLRGEEKTDSPSTALSVTQTTDKAFEAPAYTPLNLQPTIDSWVARQNASYHIVVYDLQAKKNIATNEPETSLFAASLYKQFVAYLAFQDIQKGTTDPNQILTGGQTRKTCIDKMIRSSDSPCGEAMMADMTPASLTQRVKEMGMTGTVFNGIRTSASDTALILRYIAEKRDLNDENTAFLLDAMRTQDAKFKRGLAAGAPKATWETKVGWNENANYHDIGIMTMPDGRKFVVTILSQGSGSPAPIADFARTIYKAL